METLKQSGGQLTLMPGVSYKVLKKLHLEILIPSLVSIQYAITKNNMQTQSATQKQFLFNTSLNSTSGGLSFLGVGFHFIF